MRYDTVHPCGNLYGLWCKNDGNGKIIFYTFLKGGRIQLRDFIHVEISADFAVCISAYTHI